MRMTNRDLEANCFIAVLSASSFVYDSAAKQNVWFEKFDMTRHSTRSVFWVCAFMNTSVSCWVRIKTGKQNVSTVRINQRATTTTTNNNSAISYARGSDEHDQGIFIHCAFLIERWIVGNREIDDAGRNRFVFLYAEPKANETRTIVTDEKSDGRGGRTTRREDERNKECVASVKMTRSSKREFVDVTAVSVIW